METPAQRCARIVTALDELVGQETAALANRDFATVLELQDRSAPLVDFLVASGAEVVRVDARLRSRLIELQSRRAQNSDSLATEIERSRAELQQTQVTQRRVARIAPAYGQPAVAPRQLQAIG